MNFNPGASSSPVMSSQNHQLLLDQFQLSQQQGNLPNQSPAESELLKLIKGITNKEPNSNNGNGGNDIQANAPSTTANNNTTDFNNEHCKRVSLNGNGDDDVVPNNIMFNAGSSANNCARRVSDELTSSGSISDMLGSSRLSNNSFMMNRNDSMNFNDIKNIMNNHQGNSRGMNPAANGSMNDSFSSFDGGNGQFSNSVSALSQIYKNSNPNTANSGIPHTLNNLNMTRGLDSYAMKNIFNGTNGGVPNLNSIATLNNLSMRTPFTDKPLVIPPKKNKNRNKQNFAQKLMHVLSLKECQSAIRWMPNGNAFCIVNQKELVEKVLPVYFKEAKYTSFTRKLNRWGFRHFNLPCDNPNEKEVAVYSHERFLRDAPQLCEEMDGGHRRRTSLKAEQQNLQYAQQLGSQLGHLKNNGLQNNFQNLNQFSTNGGQNSLLQEMQQQQHQHNQLLDMVASSMSGQMSAGGFGGNGIPNSGSSKMSSFQQNCNDNDSPFNSMGLTGSLMGNNMRDTSSADLQMRRTSLGFMPYLPAGRRDSALGSVVGGNMNSKLRNDTGFGSEESVSPFSRRVSGLGSFGTNDEKVANTQCSAGFPSHSITPSNESNSNLMQMLSHSSIRNLN